MKKSSAVGGVLAAVMMLSTSASAQVTLFGNTSPSGNYAAFLAAISALGGSTTTINFDSHPVGALNPLFAPGVTLSAIGDVNTVQSGAGPGQGNVSSPPLSIGEGLHAPSNYLFDGGNPSSLTINFASPVIGAGLFIIDYFNPAGSGNTIAFSAFTGQDGSGLKLADFIGVSYNFQNNNMYFMGVTSAAGNIGSLVFLDANSATGDTTGIDDITYAAVPVQATPEPASIFLMATGLGAVGFLRRRKRAA